MASTSPSTEAPASPKAAPIEEKEKSTEPTDKAQDSEPTPSTSTSTTPAEAKSEAKEEVAPATEAAQQTPPVTAWQAIFSPQFNTYYFYNHETHETTWENPLVPSTTATDPAASASTPPSNEPEPDPTSADANSSANPYAALHAAAIQAGIDPSLAHLDPTLLASIPGSAAGPGPATFTAKFNARTGQFARPDARDPTHLSEHARAARMSEFYFDVKAWEEELARRGGALMGEEGGGEGKKRKRPTKKDLERFKEQKRLKKIAKTAWLRT
ncbi:hypothetical protein BDZ94DRAFT_1169771 [Collybia nuda]|uniref:WW domain-containing protein n=1 Tax=Collybia nuda TaxID=64659 RepID=A0A9P6CGY4_9AGAR|nr:hypothetical protein BDZ94DRAFT_1169771 [Collybia nuda]